MSDCEGSVSAKHVSVRFYSVKEEWHQRKAEIWQLQSPRLCQRADIKLTLLRPAATNHMSHDLAPSVFHMSQLCRCISGCCIVSHVRIPVPLWWCHTCECETLLPSVMRPILGDYNKMKWFLRVYLYLRSASWGQPAACVFITDSVPALLRPQFITWDTLCFYFWCYTDSADREHLLQHSLHPSCCWVRLWRASHDMNICAHKVKTFVFLHWNLYLFINMIVFLPRLLQIYPQYRWGDLCNNIHKW